ncbi:MAG: ATP-binding cassette domain-containing protein, partial [Bryobacteraceae bacterium]
QPDQLLMQGAVLLRVRGLEPQVDAAALPPELAAALTEPPARPFREILGAAVSNRWLLPSLLLLAGAVAAGMVAVEALLLEGLFGNASASTLAAIAGILLLLLLLEVPAFAGSLHLGRLSEIFFRAALFKKLPRIADRYFHSRLISDMAERSHLVHRLRNLAPLSYQLLRTSFELLATAAAVVWLDPSGSLGVAAILAAAFVPLVIALPLLNERDLRLRTHTGALTRFYLDAMLGLTAIRAQRAETSMRYEQEKLLGEWRRAARQFHFTAAAFEAIQLTAAFALVVRFVFVTGASGGPQFLLLAYWALRLPALAQQFGTLARQYPYYRNLALRLLEPLGAPEEGSQARSLTLPAQFQDSAPEISFRGVSVEVSGHTILEKVDLTIDAGSHVAVVGASGAGKSSLAGVLLGWFRPSAGEVLVDGRPLDVQALRLHTAWVDPAVQLWNRSLRANVAYGNESCTPAAVDRAELGRVIEKLPEGIDTHLGEGGGLISGGEGQRVRFARALARQDVRLAILDEPFRGLDREQRRTLLRRARETWRDSTLLCITHDIAETESFDRVIVVEAGRIAEQGSPAELRARPGSRYAHLLASEERIRKLWSDGFWRRIRVEAGCVEEAGVETI